MRQMLGVLVGSLALALGPTDARAQTPAATVRAFSDSLTLPPADDPPPIALAQGAAAVCPAPAGSGGAQAPKPEDVEKAIEQYEQLLRQLPANDPQRAPYEAIVKTMRDAQKAQAARAAAPPPAAPAASQAKPLTFEQALSGVRQALDARAGRAAMTALAASPEGKDPARASLAAAAAIAANNPGGALAALLTAHARAPKDPTHLVNAAAVLNALGRPAEALAFLDKAAALGDYAAPPGMKGRAILLNNRGHALLALKRFGDAEKALAQAVALEPRLSEAKANLAGALLCQRKEKEAVRSFLASAWRTPAKRVVCDRGDVQKGMVCGGRSRTRKPAAEVFDLSAGTEGKLPDLPYPMTLEEMQRLAPFYEKLAQDHQAWLTDFNRRESALRKKIAERRDRANAKPPARRPSRLTQRRFDDVLAAMSGHVHEPGLRELDAAAARAYDEIDAAIGPTKTLIETTSCSPHSSYVRRPGPFVGMHRDWLAAATAYDKAFRAYYKAAHKHVTGLVANLSDPLHHEYATLQAEQFARSKYRQLSGHTSWVVLVAKILDCGGAEPEAADATPDAGKPKAPPCPPFVAGAKFTLKLGPWLQLQVNCEQVEVEATPGNLLSPYASVGYKFAPPGTLNHWGRKFDGLLTVGAGLKATAGPGSIARQPSGTPSPLAPFEVSAKLGAYATFNGDGDCVDLGVTPEVAGAAAVGAFGVELGGAEGGALGGPVSLASAIAGP